MSKLDNLLATSAPSPGKHLSIVRKGVLFVTAFAFFALAVLSPVLSLGLDPDAALSTSGESSPLRQLCYILVAAALLYALKPLENYRRVLAIPMSICIALLYCWISVSWAIEPAIAFRRIALTTLMVWTIFAMMRQMKFEEVLFVLRCTLVAILVLNYATVILFPSLGMHNGNKLDNLALIGDWRGILGQKNIAGAVCAMTVLLFSFKTKRMAHWVQFAVIAAAAYFLYRSNSKTSVALCLTSLVAGVIFLRYRLRHKGVVIAILAMAAIAVTILNAIYQNPLLGKLDDPKAFTGRTKIWNMLIQFIGDHPLLGSGFGSFWNIGPNSPVFTYASNEVTRMPYGHNGFLDMTAQLGIPGFLLIFFIMIILPFRRLIESPLLVGQKGALLTGLFLFCVGYNFTETALFYADSFVWIMLLVSIGLSQTSLINYQPEKFDVHRLLRLSPRHRESRVEGRSSSSSRSSVSDY